MNRRQLLTALAATPAASQLSAQSPPKFRFRSGLVAYSYRQQLAAKTMSYPDLIQRIADWGLDGLDCTVYWFPDTSPQYLASLRKAAFKNGVQIYNAGVRVQLAQPTPELRLAEFENIKKWVDVADRLGAGHVRVFGGNIPKGATEAQAIAWAAEVLKRGAEYSGSKGIMLGVENDYGLTIAAGPTAAIVKQADSPWAGVNADTGNLRTDGYKQLEILLPVCEQRPPEESGRRRRRHQRARRLEPLADPVGQRRLPRLRRPGVRSRGPGPRGPAPCRRSPRRGQEDVSVTPSPGGAEDREWRFRQTEIREVRAKELQGSR